MRSVEIRIEQIEKQLGQAACVLLRARALTDGICRYQRRLWNGGRRARRDLGTLHLPLSWRSIAADSVPQRGGG
jgi:hypothetical protein